MICSTKMERGLSECYFEKRDVVSDDRAIDSAQFYHKLEFRYNDARLDIQMQYSKQV